MLPVSTNYVSQLLLDKLKLFKKNESNTFSFSEEPHEEILASGHILTSHHIPHVGVDSPTLMLTLKRVANQNYK